MVNEKRNEKRNGSGTCRTCSGCGGIEQESSGVGVGVEVHDSELRYTSDYNNPFTSDKVILSIGIFAFSLGVCCTILFVNFMVY